MLPFSGRCAVMYTHTRSGMSWRVALRWFVCVWWLWLRGRKRCQSAFSLFFSLKSETSRKKRWTTHRGRIPQDRLPCTLVMDTEVFKYFAFIVFSQLIKPLYMYVVTQILNDYSILCTWFLSALNEQIAEAITTVFCLEHFCLSPHGFCTEDGRGRKSSCAHQHFSPSLRDIFGIIFAMQIMVVFSSSLSPTHAKENNPSCSCLGHTMCATDE